jgi:hypothetical protein
MKKSIIAVTVLVLMSIMLSACNLSSANPTQISPDQINTIAAQTVEALTTQMAPPPATATNTPEPPTATPDVTATPTLPIPTLNLTPVVQNTLIPIATLPGGANCNSVFFLKDVTIPDGTVIKEGATFTKKWQLQNNGTCTWTTLYSAVPFSNDPASPAISGDNAYPIKANVGPGGVVEVAVQMIAPKDSGSYTQVWKMQDDQGNFFGIGGPNGAGWYVNIKVTKSGAADTSEKVTNTTVSSSPAGGDSFDLDGTITTNASLFVRAWFEVDGDKVSGCTDFNQNLNGTGNMVTCNFDCSSAGISSKDVIAKLYFGDPGAKQVYNPGSATISCP